jgi:hypothetical protein
MADLAGRVWRDTLEGDEHDENMGVSECRGHIVKLRMEAIPNWVVGVLYI